MIIDIEQLMERIGEMGVTVIIKVDGERDPGEGRWTFVASGGSLADVGPIRMDSPSLRECLVMSLSLLRSRGDEWRWLDEFKMEGNAGK